MNKKNDSLTGLTRREFIQGVAAASSVGMLLPLFPGKSLAAEKFPDHEITHIIAFKPGGSSDRASRPLKPYLDKHFGVPVVMENVGGASGMIGWTQFANAKPDGYTMCFINHPLFYQSIRFKKPRYKMSDFLSIGGLNDDPMLFVRHKDSKHKWNSFKDFVEDCKKNPNKYRFSMTGPASPHNIAAHAVMDAFKIKFIIVNAPGGSGPAAAMLAGQHVDGMVGPALSTFGLRDTATCFGILSDTLAPHMWPEGKSISATTGVKLPNISIARGFATHSKVKQLYPDRYQWLVEKFKAAATDPDFVADMKKKGMSDVMFWYSPEKLEERAKTLRELVDKYAFLFERKKKKG